MTSRPITEGLFTAGPTPALIGGRRLSDDRIVFPMPTGPDAAAYAPVELAREGRLWSFTVQRFRPKSPPYAGTEDERSFKPYALGYIELPGQVIVESRIETEDFASLRVGLPMRLTTTAFARAADGVDLITYAFKAIDQTAGAAS